MCNFQPLGGRIKVINNPKEGKKEEKQQHETRGAN